MIARALVGMFGVAVLAAGCSAPPLVPDAGFEADSGSVPADAGQDAGGVDAGTDGGTTDAGIDAGSPDAGIDGGSPDAGTDGGSADAGIDGGSADAGPCLVNRTVHTGMGTAYTAGSAAIATQCFSGIPNAGLVRAAIAAPDYNNSALCGACARVTGPSGTAIVVLDDQCPSCTAGSLDFTDEALVAVAGSSNGTYPITWDLVPCAVSGAVQVDFQGSNFFYLKFRLSNHRHPVTKVEVRPSGAAFISLTRTSDNFYVLTGGGPYAFPLDVRATDSFGQVLDLVVPALQNSVRIDGGAQFPSACAP
jgi:expansin